MSAKRHPVFTIGHSNHSLDTFLSLLGTHGVDLVADVRSTPYSRWVPHFNKNALGSALKQSGISYEYVGEELGGRPGDPSCYDENGQVMYDKVAATDPFQDALSVMMHAANERSVVLMCAERDPLECHRTLLVSKALVERGVAVEHILADGGLESYDSALNRLLDKFKLPINGDMLRTRADVANEAFMLQAKKFAYVRR